MITNETQSFLPTFPSRLPSLLLFMCLQGPSSHSILRAIYNEKRRKQYRGKKEGEIYLLRGVMWDGEVFWKVGRSRNASDRFKQHKSKCRIKQWRFVESWRALQSHRTGKLSEFLEILSD